MSRHALPFPARAGTVGIKRARSRTHPRACGRCLAGRRLGFKRRACSTATRGLQRSPAPELHPCLLRTTTSPAPRARPRPPPTLRSDGRRRTTTSTSDTPRRSWLPDVLGILWVVVAAGCVLGPALAHGSSLGPYDILQQYGLNTTHIKAHNTTLGDQIRLFIPWTNLVWTQVHHGHIPLWNQYNVLGMPLAFNWESAPLSLPVIVGYLFPVHLAFTVQLIVTVLIAGTGAYVLGRVLHLGVIGSVMAATMFELSGPFIGWLGWPLASVMSWGGWLLAVAVLILRGQRRRRAITLGAVVLAFSFYAGDPEGTLLLGLAIVIFCVVVLALRLPLLRGSGPIRRPITDFVIMAVTGVLLAAPLLLPGLQVASGSNRTAVGPSNGPQNLPLKDLIHLVFQSFDGLPLAGSRWFGYSNYEETAAYVGVIGLVLAPDRRSWCVASAPRYSRSGLSWWRRDLSSSCIRSYTSWTAMS